MSLFGGDSAPASPDQDSDFSITPIDRTSPDRRQRSISQASQERSGIVFAEDDSPKGRATFTSNNDDAAAADHSSMDEDDDTRPNRFHGSDRNWRYHAQNEIALAASLEQLQANDLSSHLYGAHALKRRLRKPATNDSFKSWQRKSGWIARDGTEEKPWYPDADWTAWPLDPESVPKGDDMFGAPDDGLNKFTLQNTQQEKTSRDLEEQLYANLLNRAKEIWDTRPDKDDDNDDSPDATSLRPSRQASMSARSVSRETSHLSRSRATSVDIDTNWSLSESHDKPPPPRQPSVSRHSSPPSPHPSHTFDSPSRGSSVKDEDTNDDDEDNGVPVFSADDDNSRRILQPTVRHILSRFDDLLVALHHNRKGHHRQYQEGDTSDSSARSRSRSRSRSSRRAATPAPKRRKSNSRKPVDVNEDTAMVDVEEDILSPHPAHSRSGSAQSQADLTSRVSSPHHELRKLGVRDWSEVLGIAALIGWDPTVLDRTAKRCTALFGENMTFRSLAEFKHAPISDEEDDSKLEGWSCPDRLCDRHFHCFPSNEGFRWRAHLKKKHKYSRDEIAEIEADLALRGLPNIARRRDILANNPREWQPPDPLMCPHCTSSETVYPKIKRLLDHIIRTHKYDPRIQPSLQNVDEESDEVMTDSADEDMVGGVHNDGFLQPVRRRLDVRGGDLVKRLVRAEGRRTKEERKIAKRKRDVDLVESDG